MAYPKIILPTFNTQILTFLVLSMLLLSAVFVNSTVPSTKAVLSDALV